MIYVNYASTQDTAAPPCGHQVHSRTSSFSLVRRCLPSVRASSVTHEARAVKSLKNISELPETDARRHFVRVCFFQMRYLPTTVFLTQSEHSKPTFPYRLIWRHLRLTEGAVVNRVILHYTQVDTPNLGQIGRHGSVAK